MNRFLSIVLPALLVGCGPAHSVIKDSNGVSLALALDGAEEVLFASSLDGYAVHKTRKNDDGVWLMSHLDDREFRYFYIIDGRSYVPECSFLEKDDFGQANCIYQP
jgi:hypothetical protein